MIRLFNHLFGRGGADLAHWPKHSTSRCFFDYRSCRFNFFFFVFTFYGSLNAVKFQYRQNATSDIVMVYPQEMLSDVLIPHVWPVALSKVLSYVLQTI